MVLRHRHHQQLQHLMSKKKGGAVLHSSLVSQVHPASSCCCWDSEIPPVWLNNCEPILTAVLWAEQLAQALCENCICAHVTPTLFYPKGHKHNLSSISTLTRPATDCKAQKHHCVNYSLLSEPLWVEELISSSIHSRKYCLQVENFVHRPFFWVEQYLEKHKSTLK